MKRRTDKEIISDAESLYRFHADCGPSPLHADLIVAAGSHDLRVPRHAARLWLQGAAPWLLCTGGLGKVTGSRWNEPEAVLFARECTTLGVSEEKLLLETHSTNTGENFLFSRKLIYEKGVHAHSAIIVCKPYMSKRCLATAQKQWPELDWAVNAPPISFLEYINSDCPLELEIALMVGDLQRLRIYAEQGFQVPVTVPENIWMAYERLVNDGYDQYVVRDKTI